MTELKNGTKVKDRYTLKEFKGSGSFGEVWLAQDDILGNEIAIKIYISLDSRGVEEFKSEYMTTQDLSHPNLLTPQYFDIWEQRPFLVMKYCSKGSSSALAGSIDEPSLWQFIHDVAAGLQYLHNLPDPIIHQDIKPDNILVDESNRFLITDFGISKKIRATMRKQSRRAAGAGATAYMGPERFESYPTPVKASDIWSLGVSIYELAAGELPFSGLGGGMQKNGAEIPALDSKWSDDLNKVMQACLAKETWDRPTADKLVEISENKINGKPIIWQEEIVGSTDEAPTPEPPLGDQDIEPTSNKWCEYKLMWYIAGCVLLIACAIGFFQFSKKPTVVTDISQPYQMPEETSIQNPESTDIEEGNPTKNPDGKVLSAPKDNPVNNDIYHREPKTTEGQTPRTSTKSSGNYSFGYAEYSGDLINGKPHGKGKLTFTSSHTDNRLGYNADAGDYIEGYFTNGSLDPGATLHKKDGTNKKLY